HDAGQTFFPGGVAGARAPCVELIQRLIAVRFDNQRPPHAQGGDQQNDGKGQGSDYRHALQRLEPARQEQHSGDHTFQNGPEGTLRRWRLGNAARRQGVDDQRGRVGRRDKKRHDEDDGDRRHDGGQRQLFQQPEDGDGVVLLHVADKGGVSLVENLVECRFAKHRKPEECEKRRHQHDTNHKLADGAAPADLGNEQSHKGRPGDGPPKDEQGPVSYPVAAGIGLQVEGALDDVVQIGAGILQKRFQNENSGPGQENEQHQRRGQKHVEQRQVLYAFVQTGQDRKERHASDDGNGNDLYRGADGYGGPQVIQPRIDLDHGQAQCGREPEHGTQYGDDIDGMPDGPVDAFANQWVQGRAHGKRQTVPEREIRQDQTNQAIDGPDVKTPVKESNLHGLLGRIDGLGSACRTLGIMKHRLAPTKKQQRNAIAG